MLLLCVYSADGSDVDEDSMMLHLQSEFATLKSTSVNQLLPWRSWWSLNKEKFKYLFPIAQTILSLAASEAAGIKHTHIHTYTCGEVVTHTYILTHTHTYTHIRRSYFICTCTHFYL